MTPTAVQQDLAFLVANITTPPEQLLLLRSTLELSLIKLGHAQADVEAALQAFYARTLH